MRPLPVQFLFLFFFPAILMVFGGEEPALPEALPRSHYAPLWKDSVFHRVVIPAAPGEEIEGSLSQILVLEGIVEDELTGPMAFLRHTETGMTYMVTREPQPGVPYRLVRAKRTEEPAQTFVTVTDGQREATIRFRTDRKPPPPPQPDTQPGEVAEPATNGPDETSKPVSPTRRSDAESAPAGGISPRISSDRSEPAFDPSRKMIERLEERSRTKADGE